MHHRFPQLPFLRSKTRSAAPVLPLLLVGGTLGAPTVQALEWLPVSAPPPPPASTRAAAAPHGQTRTAATTSTAATTTTSSGLRWELVDPRDQRRPTGPAPALLASVAATAPLPALLEPATGSDLHGGGLRWVAVLPGEEFSSSDVAWAIDNEEQQRRQAEGAIPQPIAWVTGGLGQISRGEQGLPAISQLVPNAYGSRWLGFQLGVDLLSCGVNGSYRCGDGSFSNEIRDEGVATTRLNLGLGDPTRWFGLDVGLSFTRESGDGDTAIPVEADTLDLAVSRNLSPDLAVKVGARNLTAFNRSDQNIGRSTYAVISGRIDLGDAEQSNRNDLYVTAGMANGLYRSLATINSQGSNDGTPQPVAALAWVIDPQVSLIAEWWGRNLNLAASVRPLRDVNWVITPGVTSLVRNSDWDNDQPGGTDRVRVLLSTSLSF